jgi:non-heme chloroperoxidase
LSADDWDSQMMFFLEHGFRVIAHDRRGHGRSTQTFLGHDMDTYAADVAELVEALDLKGSVHIGHSTGGGEVTRYVARHGEGRVVKAVLISAIPPTFMRSARNPDGVPKEVVDDIRAGTANHRSQFYKDITRPFYGFNRPGAIVSEGIRENWWRQGMMGGITAQYQCVKVLSETEFYDRSQNDRHSSPGDARRGRSDLPVPNDRSEVGQAPQARHAKVVPGLPARHADHDADQINADLLSFIRG